jgi:hypothetical protein
VKRTTRWGGLAVLLGAAIGVAAVAGATGGNAATDAKKPIVIGWAFDSSGNMAPFDNPALAAAKIRVKQINAKGGVVGGRHLVIKTWNTQGNNPTRPRRARQPARPGRQHHLHDVRRRLATPVVQEAINRGVLAVAPCIGTDQMGPKRFAAKGKLAFSFGNVARTRARRWRSTRGAGLEVSGARDRHVIVYFKNVVQAFDSASGSSAARSSTARLRNAARTTSERGQPR